MTTIRQHLSKAKDYYFAQRVNSIHEAIRATLPSDSVTGPQALEAMRLELSAEFDTLREYEKSRSFNRKQVSHMFDRAINGVTE